MQRDSIPKLPFALGASGLGEILYSEWPRICEKQVFLHEEIERLKYNLREIPEKEGLLINHIHTQPLLKWPSPGRLRFNHI